MRFDRQVETAKRLIKKNGMQVVWQQTSETTVPGSSFIEGDTTTTNNDAIICFVPAETVSYMVGTNVPVGSMVGLMGAVDFVPSNKDVVIRGSETLRVSSISKLAPNGQVVLYTVVFE